MGVPKGMGRCQACLFSGITARSHGFLLYRLAPALDIFLVDAGAGLGIIPTRVALPDGLTEDDSANAVRSPWSAVPSATQLASP